MRVRNPPRRKMRHRGAARRPTSTVKQTAPNNSQWTIAAIPITQEQIFQTSRLLAAPRDCVINAMQLLGIVPQDTAAVMRIMVGDTGLLPDQVTRIFEFVYRRPFILEYQPISNLPLLDQELEMLPFSHAAFVGIRYPTGSGHVFIVGKSDTGSLVYLDPQRPTLCNLYDINCKVDVFGSAESFFILKYGDYSQLKTEQTPVPVPMDINNI